VSSMAGVSQSTQFGEKFDFTARLEYLEPRWYAAQTCSRHEKTVAERLDARGVEHVLPLYERLSRWKDRRVRIKQPVFAGYVFVRLALRDRLRALEIPGFVRLVGFGGLPVALPDDEMEAIRIGVAGHSLRAEPHPYLPSGTRVRVHGGPLAGLDGILMASKKGGHRVVVSIHAIRRSMAVEVDAADVTRLHPRHLDSLPAVNSLV
jgi:transcription termination/antitermination protein NusG